MLDTDGWRVYPPEANFSKSEETGFRGVKTFRLAVVPEKAQTRTPVFEFACFDPETGTYQTIKSAPSDLVVEGLKPPEPALQPTKETHKETTEKAPAKPEPLPEPVLQESLIPVASDASFWKSRKAFWGLQALIAAALGGAAAAIALSRARARRGPGPELLRQAHALQNALRSTEDRAEFLRLATRVVQLRTAARSGQPEAAVDAAAALGAFSPEESVAHEIQWLFETDASARFGGTSSSGSLKPEERTRVLSLLDHLV
jgi:hypothetical protein